MNKTVLICEDDEGIIDVTRIVLEEKGYDVESITHGSQIFNMIQKKKPNLILLDLWMPDITGEELAFKLRDNPSTKDIPIIIVSASKDIEKIAKLAKVNAFLAKPFDITDMESIVEKHIS